MRIRPIEAADRPTVRRLQVELWGAETAIAHGVVFYQRRGFRLCALRPGQVHESRKLKPEIPPVGAYGIPLTDELDLERLVTG